MPKTRNAFALRDFDEVKILLRKWFGKQSDFYYDVLPDLLDECVPTIFINDDEIVWQLKSKVEHGLDDEDFVTMQNAFEALKIIARDLSQYAGFLCRHIRRLGKYSNEINKNFVDDKTVPSEKFRRQLYRLKTLSEKYRHAADLVQAESTQIRWDLKDMIDAYNTSVRIQFAAELRKARRNSRISQAEIASQLAVAPTTYAGYEQAKADPSIPRLKQIAKILNVSTDQLLGLT